jgi:hypothetical protein
MDDSRDTKLQKALQKACDTGNTYMAKVLLQQGANTNIRGSSGRAPLHVASFRGGYLAALPSQPRYVDGHLKLRVSDITTLISVALTLIKLLVGAWTGNSLELHFHVAGNVRPELEPDQSRSFLLYTAFPEGREYTVCGIATVIGSSPTVYQSFTFRRCGMGGWL